MPGEPIGVAVRQFKSSSLPGNDPEVAVRNVMPGSLDSNVFLAKSAVLDELGRERGRRIPPAVRIRGILELRIAIKHVHVVAVLVSPESEERAAGDLEVRTLQHELAAGSKNLAEDGVQLLSVPLVEMLPHVNAFDARPLPFNHGPRKLRQMRDDICRFVGIEVHPAIRSMAAFPESKFVDRLFHLWHC